ncbi:MAG: outer membrane protein transport protein [Pseudomonadota bacterium]
MRQNAYAAALAALGLAMPGFAHATNGMLMEGYGPIAAGMGGASLAYDNGTAAMANNPATLGLMAPGSRIDLMLGHVGPDVSASGLGDSSADAFYMPAFGFVRKAGDFTYGVGIYGQGGMGTEYASGDMAQVGVGRLIFPLAWNVNERFTVGGSVDVVWAGMDLVADINNTPLSKEINFKDGSDFTGAAKGYSLAAKLGFTYRLDDALTVGGVYQTAGNLPKLKGDGYTVEGFDMPAVVGLGLAWQANARLLFAADVKQLLWGDSMNTVTIRGPGGLVVPFQQDWDDQTVVSLGMAYAFSDALTGRVGYNYGKNPIPDANVNFLWPAIVEHHYTVGFGYAFSKQSELNFAVSYVPETAVTGTGALPPMGNQGITIEHSQLNWQLMVSYRF